MAIPPEEELTPAWLTETLRQQGILHHGEVAEIRAETNPATQGNVGMVTRLGIRYSEDAQGTLPPYLILKRSRADLHPELLGRAAHEAAFYNAVTNLSIKLPIATCYSAHHDETSHRSHVLLADLSESHFQQLLPIPPSNRHCALIVESLAQLHAAWWNSPRLGTEIGVRLDQEKAAASVRRLTETFPRFVDFLGDALLPQQRAAYEQILASDFLQRLTNRLVALQDVTLIHGDTHTGNLMLPHDLEQGRVLLIDWQLWDLNVAAIDLAFLMALHWSPPRRTLLEQPLLRHYYDHLIAGSVAGYTWDDLWRDYRESVIIMALIPIGQWRRRSPTGVIWFGLQDSMAAFEDLNCGELLS